MVFKILPTSSVDRLISFMAADILATESEPTSMFLSALRIWARAWSARSALARMQAIPVDYSAYETVTDVARLEAWVAEAYEAGRAST